MRVLSGKQLFEFGEFTLDAEKKILRRANGEIVSLPLKAVELLCVLIENPGEVVAKENLMRRVWKDSFVEESVLTQNVYLLRKTLETKSDGKDLIKNIPRRGYLFGGEVREVLSEPAAPTGAFASPGSDGAETIIERRLFERIEYEEADAVETESFKVRLSGGSPNAEALTPESRTRNFAAYFLISVAALSLVAGAAFYIRSRPAQNVVSPPSSVKLKNITTASAIKTLAVLPLRVGDEREKPFAASFAGDLSLRLGSANKFAVVPFALVEERGRGGADLQVDYVLDGEVSSAKNSYAANLRLLDAKTNAEIWTENFADADLVRLQDAISNRTAQSVVNQMSAEEKEAVSKRLPTNLAAYENFQTGYALWRRREDGKTYLRKAIELDRSFARAYAALAAARMMEGGKNSPAAEEAEQLLQRAFALDERSADAYAAQGFMRIFHDRDWAGAEASLKNALLLDANNANAHHWLAVFYSIRRRLDEAKREMTLALELDPTNPTLLADLGQIHYFAGEREAALEYCRRAVEFAPNHVFANQYLNQINQPPAVGDREAALLELKLRAKDDSFTLPFINVDPLYENLRDEPSFAAILRKINL